MSPRLWCHRISDILEAIEKIRLYVASIDFEAFREDPKTIDAVIRYFIIIGEAAGNVPTKAPYCSLSVDYFPCQENRAAPF